MDVKASLVKIQKVGDKIQANVLELQKLLSNLTTQAHRFPEGCSGDRVRMNDIVSFAQLGNWGRNEAEKNGNVPNPNPTKITTAVTLTPARLSTCSKTER